MTRMDGQRVWLAGASMGIGRAVALEMSRRGADLVLTARSEAPLESSFPDPIVAEPISPDPIGPEARDAEAERPPLVAQAEHPEPQALPVLVPDESLHLSWMEEPPIEMNDAIAAELDAESDSETEQALEGEAAEAPPAAGGAWEAADAAWTPADRPRPGMSASGAPCPATGSTSARRTAIRTSTSCA